MPNNTNAPAPNQFPAGFFAPSATIDGQRNPYGQPSYAAPPAVMAGQPQGNVSFPQLVSHYGYLNYPNPQQCYQHAQPSASNNLLQAIGNPGNAFSHSHSYEKCYAAQAPPPPPPSSAERKEKKFYCEPCSLELDSAQALQTHQSTHIKCEKCPFTAAPKVVKGHYGAVHGQYSGSGFKSVTITIPGVRKVQRFSICVGNHPDDIQRWIAERRKRFPRQSQKKLAAGAESSNVCKEASQKFIDSKKESGVLSSLLEGYGSSSSEDEKSVEALGETEKFSSSAKTYNIVSLGKSSTADNENEVHQENYRTRPCRYFMRNGKCRNGDHCNFSHDQSSRDSEQKRVHLDAPTPKKPKVARDLSSTRKQPSSLLHKLLANDIQREAALTLQLLEFIVMSNFLQDSSTEPTCSTDITADILVESELTNCKK
jgi:Zinc finger C-x8-C-x5-C-x3-H type (and similar)/Nuclear fragile X mental retardation-interacting protein 1 (NUFIP1)